MKPRLFSVSTALVLALLVTACATDGGVSARKQEKSGVYATCRPWQKEFIDKGVIAKEFSPDMVYIAMGKPDKVETKDFPDGRAEMWIYTHVYPSVDAIHGFRHANFTTDSAYQPQPATTQVAKQSVANRRRRLCQYSWRTDAAPGIRPGCRRKSL